MKGSTESSKDIMADPAIVAVGPTMLAEDEPSFYYVAEDVIVDEKQIPLDLEMIFVKLSEESRAR